MKQRFFYKYDVQIVSAIVMLIFGMVLTFLAFVESPYGEVPESTRSVFGRCLMFSGSMLGVGAYVGQRFSEMDKKIDDSRRKGGEG